MSYKKLKKDHHGRSKGSTFKTKQHLDLPQKYGYLAGMIDTSSSSGARLSSKALLAEFNNAKYRGKKKRIKMATVSVANKLRYEAETNPDFTQSQRLEYLKMANIYESTYKQMKLDDNKKNRFQQITDTQPEKKIIVNKNKNLIVVTSEKMRQKNEYVTIEKEGKRYGVYYNYPNGSRSDDDKQFSQIQAMERIMTWIE